MTTPPTVPSIAVFDLEGRIASDLACVRCGYNLRGLAPAGPCPECGTQIERSLYGNRLAYADPDWVARLAKGAAWTVRGINCILLTYILLIVAFVVVGAMAAGGRTLWDAVIGVAPFVGGSLVLFGLVSLVLGYWWLTQPDPGRPDEDEDQKARRMGRIGLLGAPLAGLVTAPFARLLPNPFVIITGALLTATLFIVGCIGFFGYLARLASRLPDAVLARRSRSIGRGLVVCILLYSATMLVSQMMVVRMAATGPRPGGPPTALLMVPSCFLIVMGLAMLFYLNRALRLLMVFRKQLRQTLEQARQNWSVSDVPLAPPTTPDVQG